MSQPNNPGNSGNTGNPEEGVRVTLTLTDEDGNVTTLVDEEAVHYRRQRPVDQDEDGLAVNYGSTATVVLGDDAGVIMCYLSEKD